MAKTSTVPEPLPAHLFWESEVATRLGVSRAAVRALRKANLFESEWRFHGNAVALTAQGLAKIEQALAGGVVTRNDTQVPAALKCAPGAPPASVPPGPPPKARFVVVKVPVHRIDQPQKKLVIVRAVPAVFAECRAWDLPKRLESIDTDPRERPVRVRDNTNFRPGMVLEAAEIGGGMWQFLGRLPRRPGKW